jgi:putative two-component system response regulator
MKNNLIPNHTNPRTLLLVDDEPTNLHILKQILQDDYHLLFAKDSKKALEICKLQHPDLILLDVLMPEVSGFETCWLLQQDERTARIPVIFVTAMSDSIDEAHGFDVGAVDYISKPVSPAIVKARVATHLSLVRFDELQETRQQIICRLGRAAEYRDNETGLHVIRISHYSRLLALAAGCSEAEAEEMFHAAPMHDIGKIGIPDHILLKPGKLTEEEWQIMRQHPQIGAEIIGEHESSLLKLARTIALTHHEKWDGSGYPQQLKAENIPLAGRIVSVVDVFDALTTRRPYKEAWSIEEAIAYLQKEAGRHFDPDLVRLFVDALPEIKDIMRCWAEESLTQTDSEEKGVCYA